jgi:hypothetical protein
MNRTVGAAGKARPMGRLPLLVSLDMYPHIQAAPDPKKSPSTCTHAGHHGITRRQEQLSGPKYERCLLEKQVHLERRGIRNPLWIVSASVAQGCDVEGR